MKFLFSVIVLLLMTLAPAEARKQRIHQVSQDCNILWPCEGVIFSPRGERAVKAMGGFGVSERVYRPRAEKTAVRGNVAIVAHPSGCPARAFCGCGAAVRVFGSPIRSLWLAANWFKFPRTSPAPGMVAVRRHHVFVLEVHLEGNMWRVFDPNSGGHLTRIHARSIQGYEIVNPHGA